MCCNKILTVIRLHDCTTFILYEYMIDLTRISVIRTLLRFSPSRAVSYFSNKFLKNGGELSEALRKFRLSEGEGWNYTEGIFHTNRSRNLSSVWTFSWQINQTNKMSKALFTSTRRYAWIKAKIFLMAFSRSEERKTHCSIGSDMMMVKFGRLKFQQIGIAIWIRSIFMRKLQAWKVQIFAHSSVYLFSDMCSSILLKVSNTATVYQNWPTSQLFPFVGKKSALVWWEHFFVNVSRLGELMVRSALISNYNGHKSTTLGTHKCKIEMFGRLEKNNA